MFRLTLQWTFLLGRLPGPPHSELKTPFSVFSWDLVHFPLICILKHCNSCLLSHLSLLSGCEGLVGETGLVHLCTPVPSTMPVSSSALNICLLNEDRTVSCSTSQRKCYRLFVFVIVFVVGTPLGFVLSCGDRSFFSMARSCKVPGGIFAHFLWLSLLLYHLLL